VLNSSWEKVHTYILLHISHKLTIVQQEDHEIFDLVTELEAAEGKGTTFYSWLDVPSTASTNDIAKAYRKKSMQLQSVFLK
jgi:DnaJ homolog subfamily C member 1